MTEWILGINAYHGDAAACLVADGQVRVAIEEERLRRIKHWAGFPSEAIKCCLDEAGIGPGDIARVAINRQPGANMSKRIWYLLRQRPNWRVVLDRLSNRRRLASLDDELLELYPQTSFAGRIVHVEHHLAHLASAYLVSPFDHATVVSVDGSGDFATAAWGLGDGDIIAIEHRVSYPHSLGFFYSAITQHLGFPNYGDEYKVMGLAAYGEPDRLDDMRRIVQCRPDGSFELDLTFFERDKDPHQFEWRGGIPTFGRLYSVKLTETLGPERDPKEPVTQRHMNLAASAQAMFEEAFFNLLNALHERHGQDKLCIAGGCAYNSVANGKIFANTPFRHAYIQSAAGDAGGAIGAALMAWHDGEAGRRRGPTMTHAYLGPSFTQQQCEAAIQSREADVSAAGCQVTVVGDVAELCRRTAAHIADGHVIGWFQGGMEWGPRALGNRSILADPRRADMKDILNLKIKRRESFRPFAPSILREATNEWFTVDDDVPFMLKVYPIRPERQQEVPAVTHVDGTGRLQTVTEGDNERYHKLISAFRELTGVPMLLNTSFNENEPVVCRPEEALDCFLRTRMDVLVLGDIMIGRTVDTERGP